MSSRPSRGAARLAAILDALPDGLVLVNCNGTVVNANTIALGMFETPGTALVGRGLLDLLPEFDSRLIPGSMRLPEAADERGRTKPTRMVARRTDGGEFPVEVTSASLEDGREAYDSYSGYTGDELLMLVVRDLTGTLDTEAELARSQRQTEMILRAAAEGVVGTDTDGRVVLVNPAAAQILGFRATDLGGKELHTLVLHSRPDGEPFPYADSPLADTLKSGRKHRVRGQVLWAKNGDKVPVDLTTAPVRDGDQLVGAVMTFTDRRPYEQLVEKYEGEAADRAERHLAELERQRERHTALAARHAQLTAVLADSLRGPLEELRAELGALAADDAGQLWPEANQVLHHLAAGYTRMTTLVDNVLGYQRLDEGAEPLAKEPVPLDGVVTSGIDHAVELIGPGRAQFAVHAPPIEAEVDAGRLVTALAHLVADVAGVDATGKNKAAQTSGYADSTIVVAAAQRGDVVRIEVRGPYAGGDPVHQPVVRGIVEAHGGVVQTHEVPGTTGGAYVVELPLGSGRGAIAADANANADADSDAGPDADSGRRGRELPALPALPAPVAEEVPGPDGTHGSGRRRARRASTDAFLESPLAPEDGPAPEPTGRRRGRTGDTPAAGTPAGAPGELIPAQNAGPAESGGTGRRRGRPAEGAVVTAAEGAQARPALGAAVPPQGVPADAPAPQQHSALALPAVASDEEARPTGRRRRALAAAQERAAAQEAGPRTPFALPPAPADTDRAADGLLEAAPVPALEQAREPEPGERHEAVRALPGDEHTPPQAHPLPGRRRGPQETTSGTGTGSVPLPPEIPAGRDSTHGRAFSVRTLGQGVPFAQPPVREEQERDASPAPVPVPSGMPVPASGPAPAPAPVPSVVPAQAQAPVPAGAAASGRRRKLGNPGEESRPGAAEQAARPHPLPPGAPAVPPVPAPVPAAKLAPIPAPAAAPEGRAYAIGAPAEGSAEGPEPLDGPGGAVEVSNQPQPRPVDDELPPEPLDNPRRLLVWPAPDVSTQQALSDRGYRPVIVHSREEVDAQIAAFPAALFVDPLTGPITRTALQSLRQAAVAAEVPVLLAAGLGQATREAAYGADPAVLLKALAPRDSEQHPSRVLLIEEQDDIARALAATLERRGMQVARAATDTEAVTLATQMRPNLVVMDLMQVRRRRAGIIDWLRANGQLNRTPLVVYTSAGLEGAELSTLSSGETVLFLAERSTSDEVQARIVDLLAKIGTN
ncbi:PAS domain-containing protein [Streptomyces sp. NPDC048659]|uniref:hybrid sensor histidine kinase/response regulator n=1 Tax=Streptomyces sp. NPDC048659 TaxID=3155489 RepID=UPI00342776DA